ncbi:MAG: hypothetical protein IH993_01610 [Proteobacteria bacterium]|nr:hypothetical protein [Pseudomonadota bacterium]
MKRSGAIAAVSLLLAACAARAPERPAFLYAQPAPPGPAAQGATGTVEIAVAGIPPGARVEAVVLLDPRGGRHPAEALTAATREGSTMAPGAVIRLGVTIGGSSGIEPSLGLGLGTGLREHSTRERRVIARVPLPDPAAFRDHPARWRLEVAYRDVTGSRRSLVLPVAQAAR